MFFDSICLLQLCRGKPITIKLVHRVWLSCTSCVKEVTNHMFRIGDACVHLFLHLQVSFLSLPSQGNLIVLSSICFLQLHSGTTTAVIACARNVHNLTLDTQRWSSESLHLQSFINHRFIIKLHRVCLGCTTIAHLSIEVHKSAHVLHWW